MASTSKGSISSSSSKSKNRPKNLRSKLATPENVEQFCAVTGADEDIAHQMLEACQGNLEMAINMHVDTSDNLASAAIGASTASVATASIGASEVPVQADDGEDRVRPPIPPVQAVLVEDAYGFGFRGRKRPSQSVFDGFRDFQAEAKWQEQELGNNSSIAAAARKRKTLEDLFRPPLDLIHRGSFETARDVGQTKNRWLMVNVQNGQEFSCQVLNRDVWSNPAVKSIIKEYFIFWQIYHDSEEGQRFSQFYKVLEFPYVAILDPRTGEKMFVWSKVDSLSFCDSVSEFLAEHSSPDGSTVVQPMKKTNPESIVDVSEEQQIQAAIRASLEESKTSSGMMMETSLKDDDSSDSDTDLSSVDLETFDSDPESSKPNNTKTSKHHHHLNNNGNTNGKLESNRHHSHLRHVQPSSSASSSAISSSLSSASAAVASTGSISTIGASMPDLTQLNKMDIESQEKNNNNQEALGDEEWRKFLGPESDPISELILRFPDGAKTKVTFPCSSKLRALLLFLKSRGYPDQDYEMVTTFPSRQVNELDPDNTLKEAKLFPRETIYIQQKNA